MNREHYDEAATWLETGTVILRSHGPRRHRDQELAGFIATPAWIEIARRGGLGFGRRNAASSPRTPLGAPDSAALTPRFSDS